MAAELTRSGTSSDYQWDVFLSFRGEDTRRAFTSHLFHFLKGRGINVFIDDCLQRGQDISLQLIGTIRSSRISVVVFSTNYADSGWCLQELCEIMECRKKSPGPGQVVLPVFYDVTPSDVRKQTGSVGKAFDKHKQHKDYARWGAALTEAGSLSGWDVTNTANGTEAEILKKIVCKICNELNYTYLDVAKYPVGLDYHMEKVKKHLNDEPDGVRFIVICGMRGVGKTTLAKAVFNQFFCTFKGKSFLANVGEISKQHGLASLQEQLLRDILNDENIRVENVHRGITVIKRRLKSMKVLVILDDVTHRDQLNALAREREWFDNGSKIVITTTDLDSVKEIKADCVCTLEGLNSAESLQLFSMHAFGSCDPKEGFTDLSKDVVNYCGGLPLALEVLGSVMLDRPMEEWSSVLDDLRRIPNGDIQKQLKVSYHALERDNDKRMFLDIACFFVGWNKDYVQKILRGCGFSVVTGLSNLIKRNLVRISWLDELEMHDLIRDMGRGIVCEESHNPWERSRLFFHSDILETLQRHLGTGKVEGLALCSSELTEKKLIEKVDAEAFSEMNQLRLLKLNNVHVEGDYGLISKGLRWLSWHGFPLKFLPDELFMGNLVAIDMRYSKLRATWKTSKILGNLKVLNLSHSHFLTKTPYFSNLPNLEELVMEDCRELKSIDRSICDLQRVVSVNLRDCKKLQGIPDSICNLISLRVLDISGCSMINRLPDDFGKLASLTEFLADGALITKLPLSMTNLKNLSKLHLHGYNRLKSSSIFELVWLWWISRNEAPKESSQLISPLSGLRSLTDLRLIDCNLSQDGILEGIGTLGSLARLNLRGSSFSSLPGSISSLSNLVAVLVDSCPMLESLPVMPPSVTWVSCEDCPSLAEISYSGEWNPDVHLDLNGCKNLSAKCIDSMIKSRPLVEHHNDSSGRLLFMLESNIPELYDSIGRLLYIPGSNIPELFEYRSGGPSITFQLPPCKLNKIVVSFIVSASDQCPADYSFPVPGLALEAPTLGRDRYICIYSRLCNYFIEDQIGVFCLLPSVIMGDIKYGGIEVKLDVKHHPCWKIKGLGVHLDGMKRSTCQLVDLDDAESGPSEGSSTMEYLPEDEPATDLSANHQWVLTFEWPILKIAH